MAGSDWQNPDAPHDRIQHLHVQWAWPASVGRHAGDMRRCKEEGSSGLGCVAPCKARQRCRYTRQYQAVPCRWPSKHWETPAASRNWTQRLNASHVAAAGCEQARALAAPERIIGMVLDDHVAIGQHEKPTCSRRGDRLVVARAREIERFLSQPPRAGGLVWSAWLLCYD